MANTVQCHSKKCMQTIESKNIVPNKNEWRYTTMSTQHLCHCHWLLLLT